MSFTTKFGGFSNKQKLCIIRGKNGNFVLYAVKNLLLSSLSSHKLSEYSLFVKVIIKNQGNAREVPQNFLKWVGTNGLMVGGLGIFLMGCRGRTKIGWGGEWCLIREKI